MKQIQNVNTTSCLLCRNASLQSLMVVTTNLKSSLMRAELFQLANFFPGAFYKYATTANHVHRKHLYQIIMDYHTHSPWSSDHLWTCWQLCDSSVPWHHKPCTAIIPGQPAGPSEIMSAMRQSSYKRGSEPFLAHTVFGLLRTLLFVLEHAVLPC